MLLISIILILEDLVNINGADILDYNIFDYGFNPMSAWLWNNDANVVRQQRRQKPQKLRWARNSKKQNHAKGFDKFGLNLSVFPSLENYHVDATVLEESHYPWIGKVVHSKQYDYPVICTVSCIDEFIFITSARCLLSLRVTYTRVFYNGHKFLSKAFITPSQVTRQSFDDIGLIVVLSNTSYTGKWATIGLYNIKRTDDSFKWFHDYLTKKGNDGYVAVGWTVIKSDHKIKQADTTYMLTELEVVLGLDLCVEIFTVNLKINGYYVPCYFGCDLEEFRASNTKCERAHGAEGGAILDTKTNTILGIATWGAYYHKKELPLGFSVPNSDNFFKDKECALKIRNDNKRDLPNDYLQSLCPDDNE